AGDAGHGQNQPDRDHPSHRRLQGVRWSVCDGVTRRTARRSRARMPQYKKSRPARGHANGPRHGVTALTRRRRVASVPERQADPRADGERRGQELPGVLERVAAERLEPDRARLVRHPRAQAAVDRELRRTLTVRMLEVDARAHGRVPALTVARERPQQVHIGREDVLARPARALTVEGEDDARLDDQLRAGREPDAQVHRRRDQEVIERDDGGGIDRALVLVREADVHPHFVLDFHRGVLRGQGGGQRRERHARGHSTDRDSHRRSRMSDRPQHKARPELKAAPVSPNRFRNGYFDPNRRPTRIRMKLRLAPFTFRFVYLPSTKMRVPPAPTLNAAPAPPPNPTFVLEPEAKPVTSIFAL